MTESAGSQQRRVVAGVDGSADSVRALQWAGYVAARAHARLDVVTAWEYPPSFGWSSIAPEWDPAKDAEKILAETAQAAFGDSPPVGTQFVAREGGAARILLDETQGAFMLVVGSRGHGGFVGLLLGSVSSNVAEHATCPVLIIHGDHGPPPGSPAA
jgi:nucleotide-binding universal stress UspA family protein